MNTHELINLSCRLSTDDPSEYHAQLLKNLSNPEFHIPANPDTPVLIPFNGYYSLDCAQGAYFAIDTNMIIRPESDPVYDLTLLISLDGKSSTRYAFTGTFDGINLIQYWEYNGLKISLTFFRSSDLYGPTATFTGSITLPGQQSVSVNGTTYNNPIPAWLFIGSYYDTKAPQSLVMQISNDHKLLYDGGTEGGPLQTITNYIYNLNMYYFSFLQGETMVKLIMGTSSAKGFACNNMSVTGNNLVSRSLLTIPDGPSPTEIQYNGDDTLPNFSGYYQINIEGSPLAFFSIQAQFNISPGQQQYFVMISYSMDGNSSTGFYMDTEKGMTFDNATNTLTVPASQDQGALSITFTRQYMRESGSLVNITGAINGIQINGCTLFNPVPLSAFANVPMTNKNKNLYLFINSDNNILFNSNLYTSIIYVPLMYIVAAPPSLPDLVLSLGTDGLRGLACITTTDPVFDPVTNAVYAIEGPE